MDKHGEVRLSQGSYIAQGRSYLDGNINIGALDKVDAFFSTHFRLFDHFHRESAKKQIDIVNAWIGIERKFGLWALGYVELKIYRYGHNYDYPEDWIYELEQEDISLFAQDQQLTERERFVFYCEEMECYELVTRRELMNEGRELDHCVGGYACEVRDGYSRIFSLHNTLNIEERSTLEVRSTLNGDSEREWVRVQHFGFKNSEPSSALTDFADEVELYLNYCEITLPVDKPMPTEASQRDAASEDNSGIQPEVIPALLNTTVDTQLSGTSWLTDNIISHQEVTENLPTIQASRTSPAFIRFIQRCFGALFKEAVK